MTPEGKVKDDLKKALQAEGLVLFADYIKGKRGTGFFYMPVAGKFSVLGIHDFVGCWHGVFWSIETKAPNKKEDATFHQEEFADAVTMAGGIALTGVRDGAAAVARLKEQVETLRRG